MEENNNNDNNNNEVCSSSNSNNNEQQRQTFISDNTFIDMKFLRIFIVIDANNNLTDNVSFLFNAKDTVINAVKEAVVQYNNKLNKQKAKFFINKNHQNYMLMFSLSNGMPDVNKEAPCEDKEINSFEGNEFTLVWKDDPSNYNVYILSKADKKVCQNGCILI
jgi:hypothetical protein